MKLRWIAGIWFGLWALLGFLIWLAGTAYLFYLGDRQFNSGPFNFNYFFHSLFGYSTQDFLIALSLPFSLFLVGFILGFCFKNWIIKRSQSREHSVLVGLVGACIFLLVVSALIIFAILGIGLMQEGFKSFQEISFRNMWLVFFVFFGAFSSAGPVALPLGVLSVLGFNRWIVKKINKAI